MNFLGAATYCHPSFRPLHVSGKTGSVYLPPLPKRRLHRLLLNSFAPETPSMRRPGALTKPAILGRFPDVESRNAERRRDS